MSIVASDLAPAFPSVFAVCFLLYCLLRVGACACAGFFSGCTSFPEHPLNCDYFAIFESLRLKLRRNRPSRNRANCAWSIPNPFLFQTFHESEFVCRSLPCLRLSEFWFPYENGHRFCQGLSLERRSLSVPPFLVRCTSRTRPSTFDYRYTSTNTHQHPLLKL